MNNRLLYGGFGILAVVMGAHNIVTGTGSLVFGTHATTVYGLPKIHYSGPAAYIEGAVFIAVGIYCLYRAWNSHPDETDED